MFKPLMRTQRHISFVEVAGPGRMGILKKKSLAFEHQYGEIIEKRWFIVDIANGPVEIS